MYEKHFMHVVPSKLAAGTKVKQDEEDRGKTVQEGEVEGEDRRDLHVEEESAVSQVGDTKINV
jgi:hypothetical protein